MLVLQQDVSDGRLGKAATADWLIRQSVPHLSGQYAVGGDGRGDERAKRVAVPARSTG